MNATGAAFTLSAISAIGVVAAPVAQADELNGLDWALNGTYAALSNGEWAATNDVYRDEATVRSVWTISMSCTNATTCSGQVSSDAGWTADVVAKGFQYMVKRDIPNWEQCADGSTVTGHQSYLFYPVGPTGVVQLGSPTLAGFDKTTGESGGCRLNDKLEISMPFRLEKLN